MAMDDTLFQEDRIFRARVTDARHILDSHLSHDRSPSALHFTLCAKRLFGHVPKYLWAWPRFYKCTSFIRCILPFHLLLEAHTLNNQSLR